MIRTLLLSGIVIMAALSTTAQNSVPELVRSINHQLAEMTTDNEYQKNVIYEISFELRDKLTILKTWNTQSGDPKMAEYYFSLRDLIDMDWNWYDTNTCALLLKCKENSVAQPFDKEVVLGDEAEINCLNGTYRAMEELLYSFKELKETGIEAFYAHAAFQNR